VPVKNYVNVNGRTVAEHTAGVRTAYLTDALGSVTATVNSSQTVVNTYRWKPYGDRLAKTGAGADPTLGWVGTYGYRRTQRSRSEYYMLARHYDSIGGRWTTVDPLWPRELSYSYARARVVSLRDAAGSRPTELTPCPEDVIKQLKKACDLLRDPQRQKAIRNCMTQKGYADPANALECVLSLCDSSSACIVCGTGRMISDLPKNWPQDCLESYPCAGPQGPTGATLDLLDKGEGLVIVPGRTQCDFTEKRSTCEEALDRAYPKCKTLHFICLNRLGKEREREAGLVWLHEVAHGCTRLKHRKNSKRDYINDLECCMCLALYDKEICRRTKSC